MHKAEIICKWLFWATAAAAVVYGAAGMAGILTSPLTGFPWWAAWAYAAYIFFAAAAGRGRSVGAGAPHQQDPRCARGRKVREKP